MTFWRTFHIINEDLAFVAGLILNILLIFVIKKVEVKALHKYNILLLYSGCVNLFQLIVTFIVKPIIVFHENTEYYLRNGFLRSVGGSVEMLGIVLWIVSIFLSINFMPVSYIFRYRTVCLHMETSNKFYTISLIVAFLSASTYGIILWKFHYIDNGHLVYPAEEAFPWLLADSEGKVQAASACPAVSF